MATFNSIDMGIVVEKCPSVNPIERQINTYPGVNGLQILQGGSRGGTLSIRGVIGAADVGSLDAMEQTWYSMVIAGVIGAFIDDEGNVFANCLIMSWRPQGSRTGAMVNYMAEFLQIF